MENKDIRWIQRFDNYKKAFIQLEEAIKLSKVRELTDLEKQGMIQGFEYTHELAWKTLKDFLEDRGYTDIYGSRDATRKAFELGLISDGQNWMQMIISRNLTSHTYDKNIANDMIKLITNLYYGLFDEFKEKISELSMEEGG